MWNSKGSRLAHSHAFCGDRALAVLLSCQPCEAVIDLWCASDDRGGHHMERAVRRSHAGDDIGALLYAAEAIKVSWR